VVFFNYTTMQVSAKIVYYGPGLCGKTTNLHQIHGRTDPGSRGEMVSLETEADRTLFFDLLPLEVGTIGGMRVRLQLYTVPGQVFYNTTRKLVLKGVDGIVFVADSQEPMLDANIESLTNLKRNLIELNQPLDRIPFVFQYNKRDLRNILAIETLNRHLNREGYEVFEGAALHGVGVFETLKAISRKTLAAVHRKISGEEEPPPPPRPPRAEPAPPPPAAKAGVPAVASLRPAAPAAGARTSDTLFAELEDDLDPETVAIAAGSASGSAAAARETGEVVPPLPSEAPAQANTAEVRIEFAANPAVAQEVDSEGTSPAGAVRKVATKSQLDVERELERLREIAFGGARGRKEPLPPPVVFLTGKAAARAPGSSLSKASGVVVDLRLVSEGMSHSIPGVIKVELPRRTGPEGLRLKLEIDLQEGGDD
jgi:signal recognition particle receptor subunit beta